MGSWEHNYMTITKAEENCKNIETTTEKGKKKHLKLTLKILFHI